MEPSDKQKNCYHNWVTVGILERCSACQVANEDWTNYKKRQAYWECDCGAKKAGFDTHAHMCSLYKDPFKK